MALQTGTQFGPYAITAPIGAGGMGEVYVGVDTRLDRKVAIKILPTHFSDSPERRVRFQREARAISKLNHPKICTLHDVGEHDGTPYLVMEFLEGETLAARVRRGPLPVAEALRIGAEIAEALDAAHRRGLIHRDLKPANVMLTRTGIKLLDFGLAVALEAPAADLSNTPTATSPVTAAGTVIGTLPYMAPEQVEGEPVDARADLFALGAVLYEMITGRRAFEGASQSSLIASILKEQPDPFPESIPSSPAVERCVRRCLAKDREERWQTARDLRYELLELGEERIGPSQQVPEAGGRSARVRFALVATLALTAGLVAGWTIFRSPGPARTAPVHVELNLPGGTRLNGWASPVATLSPDGRAVAFVAEGEDEVPGLYVRQLNSSEAVPVPDSATAEGPFFSPDGLWVGFAVGVSSRTGDAGELRKYSLQTGLTQSICPVADYFGAAWGKDGEILFVNDFRGGLWKVSATGGAPRNVLPAFRENGQEVGRPTVWPQLLPGGRHALGIDAAGSQGRLVVVDLESGELEDLGIQADRAFVSGGDRLFYTDQAGTLFHVPFDMGRRAPAGAAVALMDGIALTRFAVPVLDISENGTVVYSTGFVRGSRIIPSELVHIDTAGDPVVLPFEPQKIESSIELTPSGDRLAVATQDGSIWIHDLDRGTRSRLPSGDAVSVWSLGWSPDGLQIAFSVMTADGFALMSQPTTGALEPREILSDERAELYMYGWTPDGSGILYGRYLDESLTIRLVRPEEGAESETLVDGLRISLSAALSPDGRWLAYDSPDPGDFEVFVQSMTGASDRFVVSSGGGRRPRWSEDGSTLFYYRAGRIMSVGVPPSPAGKFGRPRTVVETDIDREFVIDPRGGFFGFRPVPGVGIQENLQLILNWEPSQGSPPG